MNVRNTFSLSCSFPKNSRFLFPSMYYCKMAGIMYIVHAITYYKFYQDFSRFLINFIGWSFISFKKWQWLLSLWLKKYAGILHILKFWSGTLPFCTAYLKTIFTLIYLYFHFLCGVHCNMSIKFYPNLLIFSVFMWCS